MGRILIDGASLTRNAISTYQNSLITQMQSTLMTDLQREVLQSQITSTGELLKGLGECIAYAKKYLTPGDVEDISSNSPWGANAQNSFVNRSLNQADRWATYNNIITPGNQYIAVQEAAHDAQNFYFNIAQQYENAVTENGAINTQPLLLNQLCEVRPLLNLERAYVTHAGCKPGHGLQGHQGRKQVRHGFIGANVQNALHPVESELGQGTANLHVGARNTNWVVRLGVGDHQIKCNGKHGLNSLWVLLNLACGQFQLFTALQHSNLHQPVRT